MLKTKEFMGLLDSIAPLELSYKLIERGDYDNSGLLVKNGNKVEKILFSLDLSQDVVERAKELSCDTIVTHHPAIYSPIKSLSIDGETAPLINAVANGMNIISMHLNLDTADQGIDQSLAEAFGGKNAKILDYTDDKHGYGREFDVDCDFENIKKIVKEVLGTDKGIFYGEGMCKKMATFCGGGGSHALKAVLNGDAQADVVLTSDLQHHQLKELIEKGKKVVVVPHYVSEDYGFYKFFQRVTNELGKDAETYYFRDKRFM